MSSLFINLTLWLILLVSACSACSSYSKYKISYKKNALLWLGVFVTALIIGLRWERGGDYVNYYSVIIDTMTGNYALERYELIPRYLVVLTHVIHLPFYIWFVTMAFFQFMFIIMAAENGLQKILPWMFVLYFYSLFPLSLIIIRQLVALTVILYAYTFISQKKLLPFLLLIGIAFCFHRTSLLCIPLYWLAPRMDIEHIKWQILIVVMFLLLGDKLMDFLWSLVPTDGEIFRYAGYIDKKFEYGLNSGFGFMANYYRYFVIILYSNILKQRYADVGFSVFYNILFISICLYCCVKNDLLFSRVTLYFSIADLVVSGYLLRYLITSRKPLDRMVFFSVLFIIVVTSVYTAYRGEAWDFVWNAVPSTNN